MKKGILTALLLLFTTHFLFAFDAITIAVLELEIRGNIRVDPVVITESLQTAMVKRREFTVVERTIIDAILDEQEMELSGLLDSDQAMQLGNFVGAEQILSGSISHDGEKFTVSVRAVNAETGVLEYADQVMAWEASELSELMSTLAKRLGKMARGRNVREFELDPREEERDPSQRKKLFSGNLDWLSLELGLSAGYIPKFTNSTLTKIELTPKIPSRTDFQVDFSFDLLYGAVNENARILSFRLNPGLLWNIWNNRILMAGIKPGVALSWGNIRPSAVGLEANLSEDSVYRYTQYSITLAAEAGIKIGKHIALKVEYEFGLPIRFYERSDYGSLISTDVSAMEVDRFHQLEGITTSLFTAKLDILF